MKPDRPDRTGPLALVAYHSRGRGLAAVRRHGSFLLLVLLGVLTGCQPTERQAGDALLVDNGLGSYYPRIQLLLPPLAIADAATRTFQVHYCPPAEYSLRLVPMLADSPLSSWDSWNEVGKTLQAAEVGIAITLTGAAEQQRSHTVTGTLFADWTPGATGERRYFQSDSLNDVPLAGDVTLQLAIFVHAPMALKDGLALQPVLVGGGTRK